MDYRLKLNGYTGMTENGLNRARGSIDYIREWGLMLAGLTMFTWSLPFYLSGSNRVILARWSYSYLFFLVAAVIVWLGFVIYTRRNFNRSGTVLDKARQILKKVFGVAVFCWGAAYMLSTLHSSTDAGRVIKLDIFGSTLPSAAILEWISIAAFTLALGLYIGPKLSLRWQNIGIVMATLVFTTIVGEGIVRAKVILFPETQGFPTYSGQSWYRKYVHRNSIGFRDSERSVHADEGVGRILIVGDSNTYGVGINNPEGRFGEQLEDKLNEKASRRWEVINASRADTHTLQHIEFLRRMLEYQPEVVVLAYVFNDIDYLYSVTPRESVVGSNSSFSLMRVLYMNSYLFQELFVRLRKLSFSVANDERYNPYGDNELMQKHFADLRRFVSLANDNGAAVRIVPWGFQIGQSARTQYSQFLKLAADFELPICSLDGAFEGKSIKVLRVNSLDSHPNEYANSIAVGATLDCIIKETPGTTPVL